MPLLETKGAGSAQGFGLSLGGAVIPNYIEEVFSTYLYTGNGSTQTITNGIDLDGEGGLTWIKSRSAATDHQLFDTERGATKELISNSTAAEATDADTLTAFNSDGFDLGADSNTNTNAATYVSWTFRKQPKFFDVVAYTGTGSNTTIIHDLGSVPGCIIVKRTDTTGDWQVYHRANTANPETDYLVLNTTAATADSDTRWNDTLPTSTVFSLGTEATVNASGGTYVAYIFAHDAGGFGLTGTDNVISCGSFTTDASSVSSVTLNYEPQWILFKRSDSAIGGNWRITDNMRGMTVGTSNPLYPNLSDAEDSGVTYLRPNATGFSSPSTSSFEPSATYIYIAIRRGPMKVPTSGTSVFAPVARTGTGTNPTVVTTGTNPDLLMSFPRTASPAAYGTVFFDKLRGVSQILQSANTNAEAATAGTFVLQSFLNTGFQTGADFIEGYLNYSGSTYANYAMTRAPGFFDEVCYTGTGSARTVAHNLAAVPELMIVKWRTGDSGEYWYVYHAALGVSSCIFLNRTDAAQGFSITNSVAPTSSVFTISGGGRNTSSATYVAYLFATCAGVSKVGSYTGTGTTLQIDCGFTGGARFVMIKRTDSTGDWYVWDSARGIVAGNDPYLLLNSTAAEVTNTDYVDTYSAGFEISSTAPAAINASAGTFIFLAIA